MSVDNSSDSDSAGDVDDSYDRYDKIVSKKEGNSATMSWVYSHRGDRGEEFSGDLPKPRVPPGNFKLTFNPTDKMLLEKAKVEIHNSLNKARSTLSLTQDHLIDALVSVATVMPRHFLEHFHTYLKTTLKAGAQPTWSFSNILTFFGVT